MRSAFEEEAPSACTHRPTASGGLSRQARHFRDTCHARHSCDTCHAVRCRVTCRHTALATGACSAQGFPVCIRKRRQAEEEEEEEEESGQEGGGRREQKEKKEKI